jgi:hypothetical protein
MIGAFTGTFHGIDGGVTRGQVIDLDDDDAARYISSGMAEALPEPEPEEERAVIDTTPVTVTADAGLTGEVETAVPKRRPGRPRKTPEWHDDNAPGWSAVEKEQ